VRFRSRVFGLLATNTIAQGETREVGLDQFASLGVEIYQAVKSTKWPTQGANLEVSIVWASRQTRGQGVRAIADGIPASGITPGLDVRRRATGNPNRLDANKGRAFQGSNVLGLGFTMSESEARTLIAKDPRNEEVLFPYINGEDLNSRPDSSGSRWIINFFDWPEMRAKEFPDCYAIVREKVKPERDRNKDRHARTNWWQHLRTGPGLRAAIEGMDHVLAITRVSKMVLPVRIPVGSVVADRIIVFATEDLAELAMLTSAPHYWWAIQYSSTLETRTNYTPSDVFETLARPRSTSRMRAAGTSLDDDRRAFMLDRQLGLTKTYNLVHNPGVLDAQVAHLRKLHVVVDEAVCTAYGWG